MPQAPLPADEILAREARTRRPAAYAALLSAVLIIVAMVLEYILAHQDIPDFDASDVVQTLALAHDGKEFPRSFLTAVGEFRLQHNGINLVIWGLRGLALVLLVPMVVLIVRAVRERGGQLGAWVAPAAIIGMVMSALGTFITFGILEPGIYREARDAGFLPSDVWDAVANSQINSVQIAIFIGSALAGLTIALGAMQAIRVGLLPKILGYLGVLIGLMFIVPLDQTNVIRAFWFGALAFVVAGRLPSGTPPAWDAGTIVAPEPRQPAEPREKKKRS